MTLLYHFILGCNEIFRPNWFAYEAMQFLNENLSAGDTIDTVMQLIIYFLFCGTIWMYNFALE